MTTRRKMFTFCAKSNGRAEREDVFANGFRPQMNVSELHGGLGDKVVPTSESTETRLSLKVCSATAKIVRFPELRPSNLHGELPIIRENRVWEDSSLTFQDMFGPITRNWASEEEAGAFFLEEQEEDEEEIGMQALKSQTNECKWDEGKDVDEVVSEGSWSIEVDIKDTNERKFGCEQRQFKALAQQFGSSDSGTLQLPQTGSRQVNFKCGVKHPMLENSHAFKEQTLKKKDINDDGAAGMSTLVTSIHYLLSLFGNTIVAAHATEKGTGFTSPSSGIPSHNHKVSKIRIPDTLPVECT